MKDLYISVYQARYVTYIADKYLDTVTLKKSKKFYKNTLTSNMIFTKDDVYISDDKVDKLTMEFNMTYRACI